MAAPWISPVKHQDLNPKPLQRRHRLKRGSRNASATPIGAAGFPSIADRLDGPCSCGQLVAMAAR